MRHALVIAASLGALTAFAQPATDPAARLAALAAEGDEVVGTLLAAEAAREAYDRGTQDGDGTLAAQVKALDADNAAHARVAAELGTAVTAHNGRCGAKAVAGKEPQKYKTKEERDAALAGDAQRVADCDAEAAALDARGKALDARSGELQARHASLQQRVDASNAALDSQERRGRELNDALNAAQDAAEAWLERMNELLGTDAFQSRAQGVTGCKARREMVLSGKDLKVFHDLMQTCARNLGR